MILHNPKESMHKIFTTKIHRTLNNNIISESQSCKEPYWQPDQILFLQLATEIHSH